MSTIGDGMGYQHPLSEYMPNPNTKPGQVLITSSPWIQLGFVGACVVVIGFAMLFAGGAQRIVASLAALAGGIFAAYAFRRA